MIAPVSSAVRKMCATNQGNQPDYENPTLLYTSRISETLHSILQCEISLATYEFTSQIENY